MSHTAHDLDRPGPSTWATQDVPPPAQAPAASARLNAVAMLKRAASNREMRAPATTNGNKTDPASPSHTVAYPAPPPSAPPSRAHLAVPDSFPDSPQDDNQHLRPSPIPSHLRSPMESRSASPQSPASASGPQLARSASASRADANRSPLPSLEQLRSRIIHERGLQRSASASAASAAARAYAMRKLLGYDPAREGATSPVSDSGGRISEEDEDEDEDDDVGKREASEQLSPLRPMALDDQEATRRRSRRYARSSRASRPPSVRSSAHSKVGPRRSRTISGMSERAEDERRAAFGQPSDQPDERTGQRKKRMSRLPSRRLTRDDGFDGNVDASLPRSPLRGSQLPPPLPPKDNVASSGTDPDDADHSAESNGLTRKPSRRELARTEMMRKLSSRRLGGKSPASPSLAGGGDTSTEDQSVDHSASPPQSSIAGSPVANAKAKAPPSPVASDKPLNVPITIVPPGWFDRVGYDPANRPRSDELIKNPNGTYSLPESALEPKRKPAPAPAPAPVRAPARTSISDMDLTPDQRAAFLEMQQVLEQQRQRMQLMDAQDHEESDASVDGAADEAVEGPRTPEMHTQGSPALLDRYEAGQSTPAANATVPNAQQWNSPGGFSDTGASLIPSMHLAPFVLQSGQERALKSDAYAHAGKETPSSRAHLQDWPSTPTESSVGNDYDDDGELARRSRMTSAERRSLQGIESSPQAPSPPVHLQSLPQAGGPQQAPPRPDALLQPPATLTPRTPASSLGQNSPHIRHQLLAAPTPSSFDSSFDRTTSRISGATSAGDGDHFLFDSVLGASTTTLPMMPANISPSPLSGQAALAATQASSPPAPQQPQLPDRDQAASAETSDTLQKRFNQLRLDMAAERLGSSNDDSLLTPDSKLPVGGRTQNDLAISPTLIQEFGGGIEWPRNRGIDTPSSETSRVTTPSGSKFTEHFDWQDDSSLSTRPSLPRKPSLGPQRSLSTRRKAPPIMDSEEKRHLHSAEEQAGGGHSTEDRSLNSSHGQGSEEASGSVASAAAPAANRPALPHRSSSMRTRSSRGGNDESRSTSRQGADPSIRTVSVASNDIQARGQQGAAPAGPSAPAASQSTPPSAWNSAHAGMRQVYRSQHHRMPSASDVETQTAFANNKLTPFPGLIASQASSGVDSPELQQARVTATPRGGSVSPNVSFASTRPHLQRATSGTSVKDRHGNLADASADSVLSGAHSRTDDRSMSPSVGLFGSLRRKASNVVRKGSVRKKPSQSSESSPAASASQSPVISAHAPMRQMTASPLVMAAAGAAQAPSAERNTTSSVANPTTGASAVASPPGTTVPRPRIVEPHSRNASSASMASTLQPHSSIDGAAATPKAKQSLPVGEESLDAGRAAPNASLLAPLATSQLAPKTAAMLHRYSQMLTSPTKAEPNSPGMPPGLTPEDLARPPRQVAQCSPVFQIVSSSTIKDRFLILFNDVLVIAKPTLPPSVSQKRVGGVEPLDDAVLPHIGWTFDVKNVIELRHLTLTVPQEHRTQAKPHPLQGVFVDAFAHDPHGAVTDLIVKSGLPNNASTIARLLAQTPDLDTQVLSDYLSAADRRNVLQSWVRYQRVTGVSIESAVRSVLLELRFPRDSVAFETLLMAFASHWVSENRTLIKGNFSERLAADLTFAIMALNDALHGRNGVGMESDADQDEGSTTDGDSENLPPSIRDYAPPGIFSEPMRTLSKTTFVSAFRSHDPEVVLSDRTLQRIYASVKLDPIQQALPKQDWPRRRPIIVERSTLPLKLVYGVPSAPITVSIPEPDPEFALRLYGFELYFDPPVLSFQDSATRTFTITSRALGTKHAVFVRAGRTARFYQGSSHAGASVTVLPRSISLTVERAFMQHCFTLSVAEPVDQHTGPATTRRKFMFSVDNAALQKEWVKNLQGAISACMEQRALLRQDLDGKNGVHAVEKAKARRAAEALALHVLRQALIAPDPKGSRPGVAAGTDSVGAPGLQRSASVAQSSHTNATGATGAASSVASQHLRTPSDSRLAFRGHNGLGTGPAANAQMLERNASVSRHYYAPQSGAGKEERDLLSPPLLKASEGATVGAPYATKQNTSAVNLPLPSETPDDASGDAAGQRVAQSLAAARIARSQGGEGRTAAAPGDVAVAESPATTMTGHEVITVCQQNSLLPLVLERSGASTARAHNAI